MISLSDIFTDVIDTAVDLINPLFRPIASLLQKSGILPTATPANPQLLALMQTQVAALAKDPTNATLRAQLLKNQVTLTAVQLNLDAKPAGDVVKSITAGYVLQAGGDPKAVLDALTTNEQQLLNYSASNPTIFGVDIATATKLAGYCAAAGGVLFVASMLTAIYALVTGGPEVLAAASVTDGLLAALGAASKIPALRAAIIGFALAGTLEGLAFAVPMITKQMIDNGSIGPGLRISSIKDAEDEKAKLSGTATPGSFTGTQFSDFAGALEVNGISAINDPCKAGQQPYSRANLADLVKCVYGKQIAAGGKTTVTKLIPVLAQYLVMGTTVPTVTKVGTTAVVVATTTPAPAATTVATTKVYTGIVSQGVVQPGVVFTARPSDLIQSMDELQAAAQNNLAPFLQALPGKVTYELKIVASIITADGFKQTGTAQKVQTGTTKAGVPTYKTVVNKFATLILYILTDKGTRTKINTIVLGPTDSSQLIVQPGDLQTLQDSLPAAVTTTDITDITGIVTTQPIAVATPTGQPVTVPNTVPLGSTAYYTTNTDSILGYTAMAWTGNVPYGYAPTTKDGYIQAIQTKIQQAQSFISTYDTSNPFAVKPKNTVGWNGAFYVGQTFDQSSVIAYQKDLATVQNSVGIFADGYRDPSYTKYQLYAPTPSEQYFTQSYFNTLSASEQARLKATYPNYNFDLDAAPAVSASSSAASAANGSTKPGANATTLAEWYQANGQALPSVQDRSVIYEQLGLGQAAYYTGTAEQNTKLLAALVAQ